MSQQYTTWSRKTPRAERRRERRRAWYGERASNTARPGDRMAAALDYVRALVRGLPPAAADRVATEVVAHLMVTADRIEADLAEVDK